MATTWIEQQQIGDYIVSLTIMSWEVSFSSTKGGSFTDVYMVIVQKTRPFSESRLDTLYRIGPIAKREEAEATYQQTCGEYATELAKQVLGLADAKQPVQPTRLKRKPRNG
jgi:hypothetical protein